MGRRSTVAGSTMDHNFSLHAGVTVAAHDRAGRERLCRYAARPPLADAQITLRRDGQVSIKLRKSRKDGSTHLVLEPVRLLRRLAWLIPPPGRKEIRFSGVLAPNSKWRSLIVPSPKCSEGARLLEGADPDPVRPARASAIPWSQLLARVYNTDSLACSHCGGRLRPIAVILDPAVAQKILRHLGMPASVPRFAPARAPP